MPLGTKLAAEEAASDGWPCADPGWAEAIKGNKIEHRMFRSITVIWRGRPLLDYGTIVELISATEAKTLKL